MHTNLLPITLSSIYQKRVRSETETHHQISVSVRIVERCVFINIFFVSSSYEKFLVYKKSSIEKNIINIKYIINIQVCNKTDLFKLVHEGSTTFVLPEQLVVRFENIIVRKPIYRGRFQALYHYATTNRSEYQRKMFQKRDIIFL